MHNVVVRAETKLQCHQVLKVLHDYRKAVVDFYIQRQPFDLVQYIPVLRFGFLGFFVARVVSLCELQVKCLIHLLQRQSLLIKYVQLHIGELEIWVSQGVVQHASDYLLKLLERAGNAQLRQIIATFHRLLHANLLVHGERDKQASDVREVIKKGLVLVQLGEGHTICRDLRNLSRIASKLLRYLLHFAVKVYAATHT